MLSFLRERARLIGGLLALLCGAAGIGGWFWQQTGSLPRPLSPGPAPQLSRTVVAGPGRPVPPTPRARSAEAITRPSPVRRPPALPPAPPSPSPAPPPWRVGLQVGHWHIAALPLSLARLRDQTGTFAAGRSEVSLNLDVAQRTARLLERTGVVVDLLPATVPNGYHANAFVAIHADGNVTRAVRGYKIAPPWRSAVAWGDATLVAHLDTSYAAATGLPPDPEITDNMRGYYAINGWMGDESRISEQTPSAVIETGFMTSAADRAVLFDQPDQVAAGLAAGILAFLHAAPAEATTQQRAGTIAAASPTGCSVVVLRDAVPLRAGGDPSEPIVGWVDRGAILPYLDSTARPPGPFTNTQGRKLAIQTGYYRVAPPGGGPPAYINRALVVVQLPGP